MDINGDNIISIAEAEAVTNLDVSSADISNMMGIEAFVNLDALRCFENDLTSLDVSNNTGLKELYCGDNQLTSLDVSNNTALTNLDCNGNQLTSLDVSNNTDLSLLGISNMPTLYEVCVWILPFPPEGLRHLHMDGSPNVTFTTDCSK